MKNIYILIIPFIFSCSAPKENKVSTFQSIDFMFSSSIPENEPGGAVLIMQGENILFSKGYGIADVESKEPITANTLFNLGSISKTFVANAILMLQQEGKLSLEDSLIQYFPDFKNPTIARRVKIKHLLTHTSGLPDIRTTKTDSVFYLSAKDAENWYPITQANALAFEPGTRYEYSNPAYDGLALIIEQVTGMKWQRYVEENILTPSGMTTSTITDGAHPRAGVAHAYLKQGKKWIEKDYGEEPTFAAAGNGGVWSSVAELARYELAMRNHLFLNDSTIARSKTITPWPNWKNATPPFIGWSWFIGKTPDGLKTVGHTGSQGGFLANYVTIPDKDISFFILCNTPRDVNGYTNFITDWLIENNWLEN